MGCRAIISATRSMTAALLLLFLLSFLFASHHAATSISRHDQPDYEEQPKQCLIFFYHRRRRSLHRHQHTKADHARQKQNTEPYDSFFQLSSFALFRCFFVLSLDTTPKAPLSGTPKGKDIFPKIRVGQCMICRAHHDKKKTHRQNKQTGNHKYFYIFHATSHPP